MQINNNFSRIFFFISILGMSSNLYASNEDVFKEENRKTSVDTQTAKSTDTQTAKSTLSYINPYNFITWFFSSEAEKVKADAPPKGGKIKNIKATPANNVTISNDLLEHYAQKHGRDPVDLMQSIYVHSSQTNASDEEGNSVIALPAYNNDFLGYINNVDAPRMPIYTSYSYNVRVSDSNKPWRHISGDDLWSYYKKNLEEPFKFTQVKYNNLILYSIHSK